MQGTHQDNGKLINGLDHIQQSLSRLFSTPVGSRLMMRAYGCDVFDIIDQPANDSNHLKLFAAVTDAILRWEDRILPTRLSADLTHLSEGAFGLYLEAVVVKGLDNLAVGSNVSLSIPVSVGN